MSLAARAPDPALVTRATNHLGISGESIHREEVRKAARSAAGRRFKYELQRTAQSILFDRNLPAKDQHATCWCCRAALGSQVEVYRSTDGSSSRLGGVTTCGMVWTCPVCAAKIAGERRAELEHAVVRHVKDGGGVYLMTLTFPHERDEYPLAELLGRQGKALQGFKNSKTYQRMLGKNGGAGRVGSVKSLENTHGRNGWHPHVHELVFCKRLAFGEDAAGDDGRLSSLDIEQLIGAWIYQLKKHGLCPRAKVSWAWKYALDVRGGEHAAEYIAKYGREERWGTSSEMTGHLGKVGERTVDGDRHRTPFQILADAKHGDAESWRLFREYAEAFKHRRQLTWSPGLKKSLGVNDRSDEEIAADDRKKPEEAHVGVIDILALALIASRAALGEFHEFVALSCYDPAESQACIDDFIDMLRARPPCARPTVMERRQAYDSDGGGSRYDRVEAFGPGTPMFEQRL